MAPVYFRVGASRNPGAVQFLVLPPDRLTIYARYLRLMLTQSLQDTARTRTRPGAAPVMYLMDEFAALSHLAPIERAMGLMAGYDVQLKRSGQTTFIRARYVDT
jgi:type IV secretion system protein VirD4